VGLLRRATVTFLLGLGSRLAAQTPASAPLAHEMLAAHNQVRARVGVPPLRWSPRLADVAQQWADELIAREKFAHRPKPHYGENLFEIRGGRSSPSEVVADWAAEARDYNLARNTCRARAQCGHYTQIVWRNTKEVGCGVARLPGREVWVCNYDPPGNWSGERPY
jgi:pathogenesis-related protein 1